MIRVLIVEDTYQTRIELRKIIEREANMIVVGEAADGIEGARLYEELRPDVISTDIHMPDRDGASMAEMLLGKDPWTPIVVAAHDFGGPFLSGIHATRALDFVPKPVDPHQYVEALRRAASRKPGEKRVVWVPRGKSQSLRSHLNHHNFMNIAIPPEFISGAAKTPHDVFSYTPRSLLRRFRKLSLEPGYLIDFVYARGDGFGKPLLYARRKDEEPISSVRDYCERFSFPFPQRLSWDEWSQEASEPFRGIIHFEPTILGYYEFALFVLLAPSFYLYARAFRDAPRILATEEGADEFNDENYPALHQKYRDVIAAFASVPIMTISNSRASMNWTMYRRSKGFVFINVDVALPNGFRAFEMDSISLPVCRNLVEPVFPQLDEQFKGAQSLRPEIMRPFMKVFA